ncbi:SAM-dependent methyltransferase [Nocardia sp. NPDC101769]|uniref:SAM-dependent methyltransferase n=1 Tax=Nocardia sp. NPDC101769 TaxID=3364333 RepID=UPI0037FAFE24
MVAVEGAVRMSRSRSARRVSAVGQAQSARIHDALISAGKDSYAVDLAVGKQLIAQANAYQTAAQVARLFLLRSVRALVAEEKVGLVVELGSGYPCEPNVHTVAGAAGGARTLYVDNHPVVSAHGRALLLDNDLVDFIHADLTDPDPVIAAIAELTEPDVPVCICLSAVAEFLDDPAAVVKAISTGLPRGSYAALSHVTCDVHPTMLARATEIYRDHGIGFHPRTRSEIAAILAGWDLLPPGLVPAHHWRPDPGTDRAHAAAQHWTAPCPDTEICCYGAVAKLP